MGRIHWRLVLGLVSFGATVALTFPVAAHQVTHLVADIWPNDPAVDIIWPNGPVADIWPNGVVIGDNLGGSSDPGLGS